MTHRNLAHLLTDKSLLKYHQSFILDLQNNGYSWQTLYNYHRDLKCFAMFLTSYKTNGIGKSLTFEQVTKQTITFYKGWLRARHHIAHDANDTRELGATSINRMLTTLRNYLRYLIQFDLPAPIPADAVSLVRTGKQKRQIPKMDDIIRMIEAPSAFEKKKHIALRNRALLEAIFSTGMRISEVLNLKRSQLNSDGKLLITGKGNKQRYVYLTRRAIEHIMNYLSVREDTHPALFIPYSGGHLLDEDPQIAPNYVQHKMAQYRRRLGILLPVSPHTLRHAFATYIIEKGANPTAVQTLLGHESLQTTTQYVHTSDSFAQLTQQKFHPLENV